MAEGGKYVCDCGCALEFEMYRPGLDVYIGERWLISADKMTEHIWDNFIPMGAHNNWLQLREYIIENYNKRIHRIGAQEFGPYIHLYNIYIENKEMNASAPLNAKLYYETTL